MPEPVFASVDLTIFGLVPCALVVIAFGVQLLYSRGGMRLATAYLSLVESQGLGRGVL